jgi:hypothetical protein
MTGQTSGLAAATAAVGALAQSTTAAAQQAAPIVQSLVAGQQAATATGLRLANQSLETALASANGLTLLGGANRSVLQQARGALANAAADVKTLGAGIADGVATGAETSGAALQQLDGLDSVVVSMSGTATFIMTAGSSLRAHHKDKDHGRDPDDAAMRGDLQAMSQAVAGDTAAVVDVTV